VLFLLIYIIQLPVVECTQNLLYIIQRRSERLALFVCYISFNCLPEWSVPKIYDISSNADRSDSRFSFVIYQSTAYCMEWSVPNIYYISSNADRLDSTCFFFCYIIQLPVVECTQNLLCIIQRRSERLALFVCYISINCLLEWSVPTIFYPDPAGTDCTWVYCIFFIKSNKI
jgi:hypothetical protein